MSLREIEYSDDKEKAVMVDLPSAHSHGSDSERGTLASEDDCIIVKVQPVIKKRSYSPPRRVNDIKRCRYRS